MENGIYFAGLAKVVPAEAASNPDAYLCIGEGGPVLKVGSKGDTASLQELADALNRWAGAAKGTPIPNHGDHITIRCNLGLPWLPKDFDVHTTFDAQRWAASFLQTLRERPEITLDHDLMVCWFANALMQGYDEHRFRSKEYKRNIRRIIVPWWKRLFVPLSTFGR